MVSAAMNVISIADRFCAGYRCDVVQAIEGDIVSEGVVPDKSHVGFAADGKAARTVYTQVGAIIFIVTFVTAFNFIA